jgi:hypothetical protein
LRRYFLIMKPIALLLALQAALMGAAWAQAPTGNSSEGDLHQQRRTELRSALAVSARAGEAAKDVASAPRKLSVEERNELRQQLRQQYKPAGGKAKP